MFQSKCAVYECKQQPQYIVDAHPPTSCIGHIGCSHWSRIMLCGLHTKYPPENSLYAKMITVGRI